MTGFWLSRKGSKSQRPGAEYHSHGDLNELGEKFRI
jgi:hypothetical protein